MKNINISLVFLLFLGLISCNQQPSAVAPSASTSGTTAGANIVWVNIDTLLSQYDLTKDQRDSLQSQALKAERSFSAKAEAFQKRYMAVQKEVYDIQQRAQTIPPVELQALEQKFKGKADALAKEEQALNQQRALATEDFNKRLADVDKDLLARVNTYLEKLAKDRKYDYILMKGSGGGVLYGNSGKEVTAEIVKALNDEYKKTKK
jgi:outer membrane protein